MIDEATKAKLAALSPDEWRQELALGRVSRYNEAKRAYMQGLLAQHDARDQSEQQQAQAKLAAEANEIARTANATARTSLIWSAVAGLAALAAVVVSVVVYLRPPAAP